MEGGRTRPGPPVRRPGRCPQVPHVRGDGTGPGHLPGPHNPAALAWLRLTVDNMLKSGTYDQVEGGLFRYSTTGLVSAPLREDACGQRSDGQAAPATLVAHRRIPLRRSGQAHPGFRGRDLWATEKDVSSEARTRTKSTIRWTVKRDAACRRPTSTPPFTWTAKRR